MLDGGLSFEDGDYSLPEETGPLEPILDIVAGERTRM